MGCFLACFGSSKSKRRKHRHSVKRNATSKPEQPSVSSVQDHSNHSKTALNTASELQGKTEEQLSVSSRKKVTFDSNVRTYEAVLPDEVAYFKKGEEEEEEEEEESGKEEALAKPSQSKSSSSEDSSVTSTGSYPSNHRYQNCRESDDDEDEELDYGASDLSDEDGDEDGGCGIKEEFDELGEGFEEDGMVHSRAKIDANNVVTEEVESPIITYESDVKPIGSNPNARDRSVYVHPVLNPVENLTQWKAVKAKRTSPLKPQKENYVSPIHESRIAFGAAEPSAKELSFSLNSETDTPKKLNKEIPVDASLSNWLVSSETSTSVNKSGSVALYSGTPDRSTISQGSNSVMSHEDRPILGALTVEELKKFSATSSPRKSPSRSPDEMPIIGTVGTYWNFTGSAEDSGSASSFKGIPNTTSKYREDKRVNWHSTPFETRLEKALNRGSAEAASTYVPRVF